MDNSIWWIASKLLIYLVICEWMLAQWPWVRRQS
jgi:hypothetical protein